MPIAIPQMYEGIRRSVDQLQEITPLTHGPHTIGSQPRLVNPGPDLKDVRKVSKVDTDLSTRRREAHQPRVIRQDTNRSPSIPHRQNERSQGLVGPR